MPRSYGRFTTNIWLDPDFTALALEEQGAYFTLGLQPDVTAAGVLPYTSRRWSKLSAGMTRDRFEKLVAILSESDGRHLIVDEDTEEVLIRKFMKWDMGWANTQKRLSVVLDAVEGITSSRIRESAIAELWKIPASGLGSADSRDALSGKLRIRFPGNANTVPGSDRVVVTLEGQLPQPLTATRIPQPATREGEPLATPLANLSPYCSRHPNGTEEPCGACGTSRRRYDAAVEDAELAVAMAVAATVVARQTCTDCNADGLIEDADGNLEGRCEHPKLARPSRETA